MPQKPRIYTVTPNPALDLSGHVASIAANEKNYVSQARFDPGGNGVNAARMARRLGAETLLLGFLGGATGERVHGLLRAQKLACGFTPIGGETRTNVTVTNEHDHRQTRLVFPGPALRAGEVHALVRTLASQPGPGIALLGGSLPEKSPPEFYARLVRAGARAGLGVAVDIPAPELAKILQPGLPRLLFLKPNEAELAMFAGKKFRTPASVARGARSLLRFAAMVGVSLADRGVVIAWEKSAWHIHAPRVVARGSVGAGDSMVGALAARLLARGITRPEQCLDPEVLVDAWCWGAAAGAATTTTEGTVLGSARLVRALRSRVRVSPL